MTGTPDSPNKFMKKKKKHHLSIEKDVVMLKTHSQADRLSRFFRIFAFCKTMNLLWNNSSTMYGNTKCFR